MEKKDWKIRQELYHRLHKEHKDNLYGYDIIMSDDIVNDAIDYFNETEMHLSILQKVMWLQSVMQRG